VSAHADASEVHEFMRAIAVMSNTPSTFNGTSRPSVFASFELESNNNSRTQDHDPHDAETLDDHPPGNVAEHQNREPLDTIVDGSRSFVRIVKLNTVSDIVAFLMCRHVLRWFGRRFQARLIANCAVCATPETQLSLASATK